MSAAGPAAHVVLVVTAGLLLFVAANDLRDFKIPNELIAILAALFFIHAGLSGRWVTLHWNVGFAAGMFAVMLWAYAQNLMGGGDLKLMTVGFLWSGLHCAVPFLVILTVFALLHTLAAKLGWVRAQRAHGRIRIPFAPSVAAALIGIFMVGCLAPV
jgi:Flp pilus assembly protein protease CpaA